MSASTKKNEVLEEQIYLKRKEVRYDMRDLTVEYISGKYSDGLKYNEIDNENIDGSSLKRNTLYVPDYQREFTWDEKRQSKLIESIILGLPIPFIFVAENKDGAWEIVDGSQRIRTIHSFVSNELRLSGLQSIDHANGFLFNDLDKSRQGKLLDTALRFIILSEETTDEVKKDMFERINRGSDLLKSMEKRKGIYPGLFTDLIYDYPQENLEFKKQLLVDKWLEKRQEHNELLLRFYALSENDNYKKGVSGSFSDYLDKFLKNKNNELSKLSTEQQQKEINKYRRDMDEVLEFVNEFFPFGFRHTSNPQTKRSIFEAISVGTLLAIRMGINKDKIDKDEIRKAINSKEFKDNTHIANQLHKKEKLVGRIEFIRDLLLRMSK
ncbi:MULTISPECIES: DUF262 domain-containing protein [Enterobacterales]|nr:MULTISPECIES: DUF262 domain-containing protein [Enterobacterales]EFD4923099.1 DUF262 domain-containing protein [Escherichia coli]EKZ6392005.1 DUF262 domain-containing protein [Klebsiella aerogenes]HBV7340284.1 DUF262 domain-containing protein [Klebsiella variicola]HDS9361589.1 DUF262 domain-containing protein [Enterobacter chengduensis]MBU8944248.1 DUF262 domain-containing protein [Klebsiella quasipneumoniae]